MPTNGKLLEILARVIALAGIFVLVLLLVDL